jgi:hypothetical protein
VRKAEGLPFDHSLFEIVVEDFDGNVLEVQKSDCNHYIESKRTNSRDVVKLELCKGCFNHVYADTITCPFCNCDVQKMEKEYDAKIKKAKKATNLILSFLNEN